MSYSFNNLTLIDDGSLGINGTGVNALCTTPGRVGPSLSLSVSPSSAQASGLVYLGTDSYPYSVALWIKPSSITGGRLIHVSPSSGPVTWSMPMLGFTVTGRIGAQGCSSSGAEIVTGPVLSVGLWTHLAVTYSPSARLQLWLNGTQVNATLTFFASVTIDAPVTVALGASPSNAGVCASGVIMTGHYSGLMDEFQLFSRELSPVDVSDLANP